MNKNPSNECKEWILKTSQALHFHQSTCVKVVVITGEIELYGITLMPQRPYFLKSAILYATVMGAVIQLYDTTSDLLAYVSESTDTFITQCIKITTCLDMHTKKQKILFVGQQTELVVRYVINYLARLNHQVLLTDLRTRDNMICPHGTIGSLLVEEPLQDNLGKKMIYAWGSNRKLYYDVLQMIHTSNTTLTSVTQVVLCPNTNEIIQHVVPLFEIDMVIVIGTEALYKTLNVTNVQWMNANLFNPIFPTFPSVDDFVDKQHIRLIDTIDIISVEEQIVPKDALPLTQQTQTLPMYQVIKNPILPSSSFYAAMITKKNYCVFGFANIQYDGGKYKIHSIPFDETITRFLLLN